MSVFREIRGVEQRSSARLRRWFQDDYFDLFLWQDHSGLIVEFQLCYLRDLTGERILEWRRGRGFQHLKPEDSPKKSSFLEDDTWALTFDGVMPYLTVKERFESAEPGLPADVAQFISEKIREYARPTRRLARPGRQPPRWLERLRRKR